MEGSPGAGTLLADLLTNTWDWVTALTARTEEWSFARVWKGGLEQLTGRRLLQDGVSVVGLRGDDMATLSQEAGAGLGEANDFWAVG